MDKVPGARRGIVAGASTAAATRLAKADLFAATGATIVDMESHHVAELAKAHQLPLLIIRAVADTAFDDIPEAALMGLNEEGRPAIGAVLRSLLTNPWQLPALIRVALRSRTALGALLRSRAGLL
jgi:adenosylhomocysteine nucleosidase